MGCFIAKYRHLLLLLPCSHLNGCLFVVSQNMLYPREDPAAKENRDNRRLVYICRNCGHQESGVDASVPVYRNVLVHSAE
jgi:hypothetical protein